MESGVLDCIVKEHDLSENESALFVGLVSAHSLRIMCYWGDEREGRLVNDEQMRRISEIESNYNDLIRQVNNKTREAYIHFLMLEVEHLKSI